MAQLDTLTVDNGQAVVSPAPTIRYQYRDHLGSSTIEANEHGQVISYEEYYPYGASAYRAAASGVDLSLKRYRFTGKERDEETGLDYFGVRYYAPWLGRWTSGDPGGFVDGLNLYRYVKNNPVNGIDNKGYQTEQVDPPKYLRDDQGKLILDMNDNPIEDNTGLLISVEEARPTPSPKPFDPSNPWGDPPESKPEEITPIVDAAEEFPVNGPIELPAGFGSNQVVENSALGSVEELTEDIKTTARKKKTFVNRKTQNNPLKEGFRPKGGAGTTSPAEHVLGMNLKDSPYVSYSENQKGAETIKGEEYFIALEDAEKTNKKIDNKSLIQEVDKFTEKNPEFRKMGDKWKQNQGFPGAKENEGLLEGYIKPGNVYTKGQMQVHKVLSSPGMKLVIAYAIYETAKALVNAASASFQTGNYRIFMQELIAQSFSWTIATAAGGIAFALVGALGLSAVAGTALVLGSAALFGYLGYQLGHYVGSKLLY